MAKAASTMYEVGSISKEQMEETKEIPLDIIEQILIRLPVKSIIKSKLVSKPWCALISHASFSKRHLKFVSKSPFPDLIFSYLEIVFIYEKGISYKCEPWIPEPIRIYENPHVVGSCNGLVCMIGNEEIIVVCNPATHEYVSLPNPSFEKRFEWRKWNFGFNPDTDEYKILHFYGKQKSDFYGACKAEVFTLGRDVSSWRQIEGGSPVCPSGGAINIGAAMYWKILKDSVIWILFFDLSEEKFGRIEAPTPKCQKSMIIDLNGQLSWISVLPGQDGTMYFWTVINESGNNKLNWTLLRAIKLSDLICGDISDLKIQFRQSNKVAIVDGDCKFYVVGFTLKNGNIEYEISGLVPHYDLTFSCYTSTYVESLISLP